jgi:hypothetical protein
MLRESYTTISKITTAEMHGTRVDRIIVAEPTPALAGETVKMKCLHSWRGDTSMFKTEYIFDIAKPGTSRVAWVHVDETGEDRGAASSYTRQVTTVCAGDRIEFALGLYNLQGLIDFNTVSWAYPELEKTGLILNTINRVISNPPTNMASKEMIVYKKMKVVHNLRGCEIETNYSEWYDHRYYEQEQDIHKV